MFSELFKNLLDTFTGTVRLYLAIHVI